MAGPGVELLGPVSGEDLRRLYQEAWALVMPGEEDFGIGAVEAQSCGTPVVALGRGGALETVRPGVTGVLFDEPTVPALAAALDKCRGLAFNMAPLRAHALGFSRSVFKERIESLIAAGWREFKDRP
jgi:glycosyltransferase involved in cell wall biosynthesis